MKTLLKPICFMLLAAFSLSAHSAILTFDDRAAFEAYVGSFTLDDLNTDLNLSSNADLSNNDYSWTMSDYACVNSSGCTYEPPANPFVDGTNDWVWTYNTGTFNFNFGITAFGLDYGDPYFASQGQVGLGGYSSGLNDNGSFFGIATDDGSFLGPVSYSPFYTTYQAFDNVTYSSTPNGTVPEPSLLALLAIGLIGLSARRR